MTVTPDHNIFLTAFLCIVGIAIVGLILDSITPNRPMLP